ncbi:type IV pilus modification PilV family protein [Protaetiibacter larvae]|uniref:Prepilin-type N-terminal cleavage/methylation domain-containing protein n=1 Tax=Protaetiibacter larvae TaxID=2592654 RepID=A0A5C1Y7Q3_9MICO|nr:prepilin-type N-terminal cleavage/methylation domain-containing protein [Protaetiibacter larvae]QEO09225.1 prepilin-type N-terminal cleavage/methylation domain-containing protein [Protaetiibacter larvae]
MDAIRRRLAALNDEGMGLIEVMVAMFLLAIIALSLLPLLITGLKQAVENTTIAAATQLANDRIRVAQAASPDCADVTAAVNGTFETTDKRGVPLQAVTTVVGVCPAPGSADTLNVTTVVTRTDTNARLASATTLVLVTQAVTP